MSLKEDLDVIMAMPAKELGKSEMELWADQLRSQTSLADAMDVLTLVLGKKATDHLENLIYAELSKRQGLTD